MSLSAPIGIFDSGFGGLTIFKEIRAQFPEYDFLYLGDNARTPYGTRSFETVLKFTTEAVSYLFKQGCPLIILACNTASAKALRNIQTEWLQKHYPDRRVLGVIRPSVEALGAQTQPQTVAVWATPGTVKSESFVLEIKKYAPSVKVIQQACPMLVPLVEAGEISGEGTAFFIKKYWAECMERSSKIDTLLLACTHYPLLKSVIEKLIPSNVKIVSQDQIVGPSLKSYLDRHPELEKRISRNAQTRYQTTESEGFFEPLATLFLGQKVKAESVKLSKF